MDKIHWRKIEVQANKVLELYKQEIKDSGYYVPVMPPVPIREICLFVRQLKIIGVNGLSDKRGKRLSGMLDVENNSIFFEARDILGRQNFDIAHELGHYELHWLPNKNNRAVSKNSKFIDEAVEEAKRYTRLEKSKASEDLSIDEAQEREADQFAASILMPKEIVMEWAKHFQGHPKLLKLMADQFEVSEAAMDIRLKMPWISRKDLTSNHFFIALPTTTNEEDTPEKESKDNNPIDPIKSYTLQVEPTSRLRTLINQVNRAEQTQENICLDFSLLESSGVEAFTPIQVLDLALFNDYVLDQLIPRRTLATEPLTLTSLFPPATSPILRHLGRLGLFQQFHLNSEHLDLPSEPDTLTGAYILIRLTKVDQGVDVQKIADNAFTRFLTWAEPSRDLGKVANTMREVILDLTRNVIIHSGTQPNQGRGYVIAQAERTWQDGEVTDYRVTISVGDIGVGLDRDKSDVEAITDYLSSPGMSELLQSIRGTNGYLQVDSGDTTLWTGTGGTPKIEGAGRLRVPGLQVTTLLIHRLQ